METQRGGKGDTARGEGRHSARGRETQREGKVDTV